ncbi:hypothetical protein BD324DRAFT_656176 [Kockovaella imperatae]|uniref:Uncharacterized protein n=1 Tax=Kockovaella imperatae TaxID=4999 RepID=A0A1Y1UKF1_9TREE|nr:hypothetical protein BD324DRAFT_656176 [Kockovaella imperatae]ORX37946.1 hypothetical protein BD324DRAFT_656176 [Kockovaella imperatae]
MSSLLPQYHTKASDSDINDEERQPLTSWKDNDRSSSPPPPSYPPQASGSQAHRPNVTYVFVPRWPVKGEQKSVLGVAAGKDDTIDLVRRAFPVLAEYSPDRIEFLAPSTPETQIDNITQWSQILDEAWHGIETNPPARLKVQVIDGPGDLEERTRRKEREDKIVVLAFFCLPALGLLLFLIIMSATGNLNSEKKGG